MPPPLQQQQIDTLLSNEHCRRSTLSVAIYLAHAARPTRALSAAILTTQMTLHITPPWVYLVCCARHHIPAAVGHAELGLSLCVLSNLVPGTFQDFQLLQLYESAIVVAWLLAALVSG